MPRLAREQRDQCQELLKRIAPIDPFHGSHTDMKSQVNTGAFDSISDSSVPFSAAEPFT